MSLVETIMSAVRRELRPLQNIVEFVTDIAFNSDGTATMKGAKADDDEGHPIDANVAWQFGFYSRPLDGASGVVVKSGGKGGMSFLVGWRNRQYEVALEKGEIAVANEAGAVSKWDKNGKISHTAKAGQLVTLNGEDYAAVLDTIIADLKNWVSAVNAVLGSNCVNGTTLSGYGAASAALTAFSTSISAAGAYKSTKVKHG